MQSSLDASKLAEFVERLRRKTETRDDRIGRGLLDGAELVRHRAVYKYLTSGPLHKRSGTLASSVMTGPLRRAGKKFETSVGTNVFYGRVWEFGAQTPGHIVKPKNINPRTGKLNKYLRFRTGPYGAHGQGIGPGVSVKSVKMSPKPWLGPSVEDMRSKVVRILEYVATDVV